MTIALPRSALALIGVALTGCALTPPLAGGPLRPGTTTQIQPTWAIAYGHGTTTYQSGPSETYKGPTGLGAIVPLRLTIRQSLGDSVEASGDIGWVDSGVELRAGTPRGEGAYPFAVTAGFRRGGLLSPDQSFAAPSNAYEGRLRFELYPALSPADRPTRLRLLLSAGVSAGRFVHSVNTPDNLDGTPEGFNLIVLRPEIRLELAIGMIVTGTRGSAAVAVAPWILLHSGATDIIGGYSQSWGLPLVFTPALAGDLFR